MGYLLIILASVIFGSMPALQKYVILRGMDELSLTFLMSLTGFACSLIVCRIRRKRPAGTPKQLLRAFIVGAVGLGLTNVFYNAALLTLTVSYVVLLHFMYPVFVLLVMAVLYHKKILPLEWPAVVLSLTGLILITGISGRGDAKGMILAVISGICYSVFVMSNDTALAAGLEIEAKMVFLNAGGAAISGLLLALKGGSVAVVSDPLNLLLAVIGLGIPSYAAFLLMSLGVRLTGAEKAGFLNMLEPVCAVLGGVIFYKDSFSGKALTGCLLILFSTVLISSAGIRKETLRCSLKMNKKGEENE